MATQAVPAGYVPLRQYLEPHGFSFGYQGGTQPISIHGPEGTTPASLLPQHFKLHDGRAYAPAEMLAGIVGGFQNQLMNRPLTNQLTPERVSGYADIMKQMYDPIYQTRSDALQRALSRIESQTAGQRRMADVGFSQAHANLTRQQQADQDRAKKSSIARGTYSSGLHDYQQRKVGEAYAPEYQQLETSQAAHLANIASQAALAAEELAAAGKDLEANYMAQIMQGAMSMFDREQNREMQMAQNRFAPLLQSLMGAADASRGDRDFLLKEAGVTGFYQGQPTWDRQYGLMSLAQRGAAGGGGNPTGGQETPGLAAIQTGAVNMVKDLIAGKAPVMGTMGAGGPVGIVGPGTRAPLKPQQAANEAWQTVLNQTAHLNLPNTELERIKRLIWEAAGLPTSSWQLDSYGSIPSGLLGLLGFE